MILQETTPSSTKSMTTPTSYIFDSFRVSEETVHQLVLSSTNGIAHPWVRANGERILLINNKGSIEKKNITHDNLQQYMNSADLSELEGSIAKLMSDHPLLQDFLGFSITMMNQGEQVELSLTDKKVIAICTKKIGTYFDLAMYFQDGQTINYLNKTHKNLVHSGDKAGKNQAFLQYVSNFDQLQPGQDVIVSAIGYGRTPLWKFVNQQPAIMLIDWEKEIIYLVPAPLDKISIGENSTYASLVVVRRNGNKLVCNVLPSPVTRPNINTCDSIGTAVNESIEMSTTMTRELEVSRQRSESKKVPEESEEEEDEEEDEVEEGVKDIQGKPVSCTVYLQQGCSGKEYSNLSANQIGWGTGFTDPSKMTTKDPGNVVLPHVGGPVIGPQAVFGTPPMTVIGESNVAIVIGNEQMTDVQAKMAIVWLNGIFIIDTDKSVSIDGPVEAVLNTVNINVATSMSGPNSIVLVRMDGKLYWYRGVCYPNLIDKVPCYADDVTSLFSGEDSQFHNWVSSNPVLPWVQRMDKTKKDVYWKGDMVDYHLTIEELQQFSLGELSERTESIIDLFTQMSIILETSEIKEFSRLLDLKLIKMRDDELTECREILQRAYQEQDGNINKAVAKLQTTKRRLNESIGRISNAIQNLSSEKGVSTRTQSIARRVRSTAISANVEKANTMTPQQKFDLFEKYCENMIIVAMNPEHLNSGLSALQNETFRQLMSTDHALEFVQDDRMPYIDPGTFGSLLEMTMDSTDHSLSSVTTIAIPQGYAGEKRTVSSIAFPLPTKAIDMKDPGTINWTDEANEEWYSLYRIMLRGTIASATASRQFNISPQTTELGFFLVHVILCAMESVVSGMSSIPNPTSDWDSTNCEAMRGLFGQLLSLLASTNKTLCPAYLLVYKNVNVKVINSNEWWIVERMVRMFPYTCWDSTNLMRNVATLISKCVYREVPKTAIEHMQKYLTAQKHEPTVQKVRSKEWYNYCYLVCDVVMWVASDPTRKFTSEMASTLLQLSPPIQKITNGTKMMNDFVHTIKELNQLIQFVTSVKDGGDFTDGIVRTVMVALYSYVKHSGNFNDTQKHDIRDEIKQIKDELDVTKFVEIYDKTSPQNWKTTDCTVEEHAKKVKSICDPDDESDGPEDAREIDEGQSEAPVELVPLVLTNAQKLGKFGNSEQAVSLMDQINADTFRFDQKLPTSIGQILTNHFDQSTPYEMLGDIVRSQLMNWKSYDDAILNGMKIISDSHSKIEVVVESQCAKLKDGVEELPEEE